MLINEVFKKKCTRNGKKGYLAIYDCRLTTKKTNRSWSYFVDVADGEKGVPMHETSYRPILEAICDGRLTVDDDGYICGKFFIDKVGRTRKLVPLSEDADTLSKYEVPEDLILK